VTWARVSLRSQMAEGLRLAPGPELWVVRVAAAIMTFCYWALWRFEGGYIAAQLNLSSSCYVGNVGLDSVYRSSEGQIMGLFCVMAIALWTRSAIGCLVSLLANLCIPSCLEGGISRRYMFLDLLLN
jgi:hypothetical protein